MADWISNIANAQSSRIFSSDRTSVSGIPQASRFFLPFRPYCRGTRSFEWHNPSIQSNGKCRVLQVKDYRSQRISAWSGQLGRNELKRRQRILSKANAEWNNRIKKRTLFGKEWQRMSECEHGKPHELAAAFVKPSNTRIKPGNNSGYGDFQG